MHKIITLLASFILLYKNFAIAENRINLKCEAIFLDQEFCEGKYIEESGSLVDRKLYRADFSTHLYVDYLIVSPIFQDGQDSQAEVYLWVRHEKDEMENLNTISKVGDFLFFANAQRLRAGVYKFEGEIFSDDLGCIIKKTIVANAVDATIIARSPQPNVDLFSESIEIEHQKDETCVSE